MKFSIKTILFLVIISFGANSVLHAQSRASRKKADKDTKHWRYEIECAGIGVQGTYLVKVWSYAKKPEVAIEQAKKNAIHGVLFKGFAGGANGCKTQKPIIRNPNLEQEQEAYFNEFFSDGGKYMKFISLSTDGAIAAGDILRVKKKLFKVGLIVSVRKDALRSNLESAGIIRGLTSGF
ncbi:MAG: hypothetical protein COB98_07975 [Flavobacteriaceae bacterium]|nr:MAG: hypothetical protein COB98_07975 [Flavobacteriaceae bacterium]